MPFLERSKMTLKNEFVSQALEESAKMSLLCRRYEISRKTGYKWLKRFLYEGESGLEERSRRPRNSPNRTSGETEQLIIGVREKHPAWGGRKIKRRLENLGHKGVPSASTITEVLRRNGMIDPEEASKHKPWKRFEHDEPNSLLQMDFKGHFPIGSGRCHPLTVIDDHSRFVLVLEACSNERTETVQQHLTSAFRRYGLPYGILTDNGSPWGNPRSEKGAPTRLEVWMIRLGIKTRRTQVRHPQTIGKDERFHRTLKAEVLRGRSFRDLEECQEAFDHWRFVYNHERPHDAIDQELPATRYRVSPREFPETLPEIEYSDSDMVRKVQSDGSIYFQSRRYWLGQSLNGLPVAVRPTTNDGVYDVYLCLQKVSQVKHPASPMGEAGC